jgi:hypothetical protein
VIAEYLIKIGKATENECKMALALLFLDRFDKEGTFLHAIADEAASANAMAASAATNVTFGEIDLTHASGSPWRQRKDNELAEANQNVLKQNVEFASRNSALIESQIKELSDDNQLCAILSGAAYNASYARYVTAGGKRGLFSNAFLTYVRTLFTTDIDFHIKQYSKICDLGSEILRPIEAMQRYGVLRPFPRNPDEKSHYEAVHRFALAVGVKFK